MMRRLWVAALLLVSGCGPEMLWPKGPSPDPVVVDLRSTPPAPASSDTTQPAAPPAR